MGFVQKYSHFSGDILKFPYSIYSRMTICIYIQYIYYIHTCWDEHPEIQTTVGVPQGHTSAGATTLVALVSPERRPKISQPKPAQSTDALEKGLQWDFHDNQ